MGKNLYGRGRTKTKCSPRIQELVDEAIKNKTILPSVPLTNSAEKQAKRAIEVAD